MDLASAAYALSRWNATKWGTHVGGFLPCPGIETCRYKHCLDAGFAPSSPGCPCSFEVVYAAAHEKAFRAQWSYVADARCVDFKSLVTESTVIALQRLRIAARANAAWALTDGTGGLAPEAHREIELTTRYAVTLGHRWFSLLGELYQAAGEIAAYHDHLYMKLCGVKRRTESG